MDFDSTLIWFNQAGVRFADPIQIPVTPPANSAHLLAADFFGDGRPGFAWTASPGQHRLTVRATDNAGSVQVQQEAPPPPDGATGWHSVGVTVI